MLVLQRKAGESLRIGPQIEVRVLSVSAKGVKIGVIAPREIVVYRTELAKMNREASQGWNASTLSDLASRLRGDGATERD